ncbi:MAG: hypothetical protein AAGM67_14140, partial [Bacteroidota bacterium]
MERNFDDDHQHALSEDRSKYVPVWARNAIQELVEGGERLSKRALVRHLENVQGSDRTVLYSSADQFQRFYRSRRQAAISETRARNRSMMFEELVEYAKAKYFAPTEQDILAVFGEDRGALSENDITEAFVMGSYFDAAEGRLIVVLSTLQLLANLKRQADCGVGSFIQTDATYKLNWSRLPVLVLGTSDIGHRFHLVALALSSHEDHLAFEFLFRTVFESAVGEVVSQVPNGLSDNSTAIRKAVRKAFGTQTIWTNCYAHLIRNIFCKKKAVFTSPQSMQEMKKDISKPVFKTLYGKFLEKWKDIEAEICRILENEYGRGWAANFHIGATGAAGLPSSNNGLEGKNRWIKDQGTLRSLGGFTDFITDIT